MFNTDQMSDKVCGSNPSKTGRFCIGPLNPSSGVLGSSGGSLLTSLFFGHAGQLGLSGLLVTFSEALVPLSLRIVDHPVVSLPGIGDRPRDLTECLVQRQIVADRTLRCVQSVSNPYRGLTEKRKTDLPCSVVTVLEPVEFGLEGMVNFVQGESLPWATVDRQLDKGRIRIVGFFARRRVIENV